MKEKLQYEQPKVEVLQVQVEVGFFGTYNPPSGGGSIGGGDTAADDDPLYIFGGVDGLDAGGSLN